jgi:methionyl-tRNA formyltransferase
MAPLAPLVFFGTPEFALPTLEALVAAGRQPERVVTQPPRPAGRGGRPQDPAVAAWARQRGLTVLQPERVRQPELLRELRALAPRVAVVAAFGQIFPRELLELPGAGCINLHASLLPRYRGAAPIQAAIAAGETRTGVTTMLMEEGLDTGPILLQEETPIGARETAGELSRRLAAAGGRLVIETLDRLEQGTLAPRPQDPSLAGYAPRLTRASGKVDWNASAGENANRIRAYTPWPGATADLRGAPVKLLGGEALAAEAASGSLPDGSAAPAGSFLGLYDSLAAVACGAGGSRGVLGISRLQRPGRKPQSARDFVNGERLRTGEVFS